MRSTSDFSAHSCTASRAEVTDRTSKYVRSNAGRSMQASYGDSSTRLRSARSICHYGHFGQSLGNFSVALYGAHTAELQDSVGQQLQSWIESQISESRERCKALIDRYTHVDAGSHVAEVVTLKKAFCPDAQAGRMQVGKAASMHIFPTLYVSLRVVMPSDQNASTS